MLLLVSGAFVDHFVLNYSYNMKKVLSDPSHNKATQYNNECLDGDLLIQFSRVYLPVELRSFAFVVLIND